MSMTPDEMITQFESLVDDSLDIDTEYNLLNDAKYDVEIGEQWAVLSAVDETQSVAASDTYLTMKTLPSDFGTADRRGIYVGNDVVPYTEIPFNLRIRFKDTSRRYYIDHANRQYAICGANNPAGTIHFFYHKTSTVLVAGGAAWVFPDFAHMLLPYVMAQKFFAIDQGDKSRSWDDRWDEYMKRKLETLREWNATLTTEAAMNARIPQDFSTYPNIIDMGGEGSGGVYG